MTTPSRLAASLSPEEYYAITKPPFSIRYNPQRAQEYQMCNEAIPEGLKNSLRAWAEQQYGDKPSGNHLVSRNRLLTLERKLRLQLVEDDNTRLDDLLNAFATNEIFFVNALEIALQWANERSAKRLDIYLLEGGSHYCVATDEHGNYEFQRRQSEEMSQLADHALSFEHRASEHLRRALSKCFGRDPEPRVACTEAVNAVEAAAKPVVIPRNNRATLSDICKAVDAKPSKWETDSTLDTSVETVLRMMELVWNKGRFRHGNIKEPIEVPQAMAEMNVQAAVVLVTWFLSGHIRSVA